MPNVFDVYGEDEPVEEEPVQGTWGRRIYGRITTSGLHKRFRLEMETQEGQVLTQQYLVPISDLRAMPDLYGTVLDRMVEEIEKQLQRSNNTP